MNSLFTIADTWPCCQSPRAPSHQSSRHRPASSVCKGTPDDDVLLLRHKGHSNGSYTKRPVLPSTVRQLHAGLAYGSGGPGASGGSSFRSGGGFASFRGPIHERWVKTGSLSAHTAGTATFQGSRGGSGEAPGTQGGSRGAGRAGFATFRPARASADSGGADPAPAKQGSQLSDVLSKLQGLGVAGVVAYGLLNTLYYSIAFLTVWLLVAKVPKGQGFGAAATSFLTVFATVWAGSQMTKLARAAGALVLAPFVDNALDLLMGRLNLRTKRQAFLVVLIACIAVALCIFGSVMLLWA